MDLSEPHESRFCLSSREDDVLRIFRKCRMTPGEVLTFGTSDLAAFDEPLAQLSRKGLLIVEESAGGYSLTETGFTAMKSGD